MRGREWLTILWPWLVVLAASAATLLLFDLSRWITGTFPVVDAQAADDWLQRAYFATNSLLLLVALGALIFAAFQVSHARDARLSDALMRLDDRWSSPAMEKSRAEFLTVYYEALALASKNRSPGHPISIAKAEVGEELVVKAAVNYQLKARRRSKIASYRRIMAMLDFFETIALQVERTYIDVGDVYDLVGAPIRQHYRLAERHVFWRRRFWGAPGEYEKTEELVKMFDVIQPRPPRLKSPIRR